MPPTSFRHLLVSRLASFPDSARAVVIGAGGGIGNALVRRLNSDTRLETLALSRSLARQPEPRDRPAADGCHIDITDEDSIVAAAEYCSAGGPLDLVIVATGVLHDGDRLTPEKRLADLDPAAMQRVFAINAVGPALVAKHFLPLVRKRGKTVFAALSARVGSIADNRLGGWASYRASKAALNQLIRTFAIEHRRLRPDAAVIALHPGTVDTPLSRPFQANVPEGSLFAPDDAAGRLLAVIDNVDAEDTGGFFAWDGSRIDY